MCDTREEHPLYDEVGRAHHVLVRGVANVLPQELDGVPIVAGASFVVFGEEGARAQNGIEGLSSLACVGTVVDGGDFCYCGDFCYLAAKIFARIRSGREIAKIRTKFTSQKRSDAKGKTIWSK